MASDGEPLYSPEGAWWWSGERWMPTLSPDGRWRWDGRAWVAPSAVPRPRWVLRWGAIWLALLVGPIPVVSILVLVDATNTVVIGTCVVLGLTALLATLAYGALLGRHHRWRDIAVAALAGTLCFLACYVVLMVTAPDPDGTNDIAGGVGLVFLGPPTLLTLSILLGLGGAVGRVHHR